MKNFPPLASEPLNFDDARRYFAALCSTGPEQLRVVLGWLETGEVTLSLEDCATALTTFASTQNLALKQSDSHLLLAAFFGLQSLRERISVTPPNWLDFLGDDYRANQPVNTRVSDAALGSVQAALMSFMSDFGERLAVLAKAQTIYQGIAPNYESCRSVVEFRPVFNPKRDDFKDGLISATLTVHARPTLNLSEEYHFQLDAADVDELLDELTRLKGKIFKLRDVVKSQNTRLLNPQRSIYPDNDSRR